MPLWSSDGEMPLDGMIDIGSVLLLTDVYVEVVSTVVSEFRNAEGTIDASLSVFWIGFFLRDGWFCNLDT